MDGLRDPLVVPDNNHGQQMNGNAGVNGRTYESFWRSTVQRTNLASPPNSQPMQSGHLQPPVELSSSRPNGSHFRRSSPPKSSQPRRLGHSTSDLSQYSPATPRDGSSTPVPAGGGLHTPREQMAKQTTAQSLQEQDAIQTLLLMGSPGNHLHSNFNPSQQSQPSSQHNQNHVPPQGSPLKSDYHSRQEYGPSQRIPPSGSQRSTMSGHGRPLSGRMRDEDIDAMIDRYRGESSDEEVEIVIPPKRTAGVPRS